MPSNQIRADIFPVNVTLTNSEGGQTLYDKARVILTLDYAYIFQDSQPKPEIVFEDKLTSYTPPIPATRVRRAAQLLNRTATFETEEGYTATFIKTGGCGCGSRLKTALVSSLLPDNQIGQAASTNDSV